MCLDLLLMMFRIFGFVFVVLVFGIVDFFWCVDVIVVSVLNFDLFFFYCGFVMVFYFVVVWIVCFMGKIVDNMQQDCWMFFLLLVFWVGVFGLFWLV